jgi:hypothetical protein
MTSEMGRRESSGWITFSGTMLIIVGFLDIFDGLWALDHSDRNPLCRAVFSLIARRCARGAGTLEDEALSLACEARLPRASSLPIRPAVLVSSGTL